MAPPGEQYLSNEYLVHNPTWDMEDTLWEAEIVAAVLEKTGIHRLWFVKLVEGQELAWLSCVVFIQRPN